MAEEVLSVMQAQSDSDSKDKDLSQSKTVQVKKGKNSVTRMSNVPDLNKQIVPMQKASSGQGKSSKKVCIFHSVFSIEFIHLYSEVFNFCHSFVNVLRKIQMQIQMQTLHLYH